MKPREQKTQSRKNTGMFSVHLLLMTFLLATVEKSYGQFNPKDRLIALYNFDGNAKDMSGNYQNGIIMGNVTPCKDRKGYDGKAMMFDGESGMIRITDHRLFDLLTTTFTFSAWVYIKNFNHSVYWAEAGTDKVTPIFCKAYQKNHYQYRWGCTDRGFYIDGTRGEGKVVITDSKGPTQGKWTFIATTYDGNYIRNYIDGVKVNEISSPGIFESDENNMVIGQDYAGIPFANDYFNGALDELRFYRRTLSDTDIDHLYKGNYMHTVYYKGHVLSKKTGLPVTAKLIIKSDNGKIIEHHVVQHQESEFISITAKEKFTIEVHFLGKLKHTEIILIDSVKDGEIKKDLYVD
jgi:hypothetical protein